RRRSSASNTTRCPGTAATGEGRSTGGSGPRRSATAWAICAPTQGQRDMDAGNKNAPGDAGRGREPKRTGEAHETNAHARNDAVAGRPAKPLIHDLHSYVDAGLQLIPLHRWDAKDSKGRARGK